MGGIKELYFRFQPYFKDYKFAFFFGILGMIMSGAGTALSAWIIEPVLNKIFINKDAHLLYILPYGIILIYAIKSGGSYMQNYYTVFIGQDIVRRFRQKVLANILNLDLKFFHEYRTGELMSRTISDVDKIRSVISNYFPDLITQLVSIIGLLIVVFYQSWQLAIFALIVLPVAIYPLSIFAKKIKQISRKTQEKTSDISSALSEIYSNIEIIKASNAEETELKRFKEENDRYFDLILKEVKTSELVSPLMETIGAVGIATVIIIGGKAVIDDTMNMGSFFSFLTALFMLYTPIKRLSRLHNKMQEAVVASERTFELLDKKPTIIGGNFIFPDKLNSISFKDVHLSYGEEKALNGINFSVKKGEILALVGSSGGGKTSIINLLMRFYDTSKGSILINNDDICDFTLKSLRDNISLVPQRVYIFNDTIANNVAYSHKYDEERIIQALKMANAYEFVKKYPNGIHTILNEFGANLSGGQRQRIAIARALYKNPQVLIFDEATSALDNESEKEITSVINKISKDKIIFVIAHRLSTVEHADNIAVIAKGKVVGFGKDEELLKSCELYKKLKGEIIA